MLKIGESKSCVLILILKLMINTHSIIIVFTIAFTYFFHIGFSDFGRHKSSSSEDHTRHTESDGGHEPEAEDELDLLYDPCLNCYFDPKTGKYYELK